MNNRTINTILLVALGIATLQATGYGQDQKPNPEAYAAVALGVGGTFAGKSVKFDFSINSFTSDDELKTLEANFQVLSTHLIAGQHEVRIYSDSDPGDGFKPSDSELEDVYFLSLARHSKN